MFVVEEHRRLAHFKPPVGRTAFFHAWTRHEAGLKAVGRGFGEGPGAYLDARLQFFGLQLPTGYQGAVGLRK
jgi:phosphopantetheinyl transferase